jgi:hypothetical protein
MRRQALDLICKALLALRAHLRASATAVPVTGFLLEPDLALDARALGNISASSKIIRFPKSG